MPTPAVGLTTALNPSRRNSETMSRPFATADQQRAYEMSESVIDVVRYAAPYRLNSCLACFVLEMRLPFSSTALPVSTCVDYPSTPTPSMRRLLDGTVHPTHGWFPHGTDGLEHGHF